MAYLKEVEVECDVRQVGDRKLLKIFIEQLFLCSGSFYQLNDFERTDLMHMSGSQKSEPVENLRTEKNE